MRRKNVGFGRRPVRGTAVLVLLALTGGACAGEVGKYRNAQPGVGSTRPAAATATAAAAAAESAAAPADGSAVADAGTNPTSPVAAASSTGAGSISGAGGRLSRPAATGASSAALGGSGSLAGIASTARTGPSGPAPASAASAAAGPTAPGQGGGSPATPAAPAPVPGGGTTTGVTKDTITIGLFYPKTGFYTGLARNAPAATQAALDEAGPINGRRVVLKTYDDGSENASTIQLEEKRAKDEVFALMSVVSESNVVLAPLADQHKVVLS